MPESLLPVGNGKLLEPSVKVDSGHCLETRQNRFLLNKLSVLIVKDLAHDTDSERQNWHNN